MAKNLSFLRRTALYGSTAAFALGMGGMSAYAQDADVDDDSVEEVVVTGTRISNPNLSQSSPVAVVSGEDIEYRQANTIEEVLREIPGVVPSIGAQVNNGNAGSTTLNLRGLGDNRNLTLLNGIRIVPAGLDGVSNLDVIPVALIERADILTGGAGSTYGADAISGVANFITKTDFEGLDFRISDQITQDGDANTLRIDLTTGANFADGRGNAVLSVGYTSREALFQGSRAFGESNLSSVSGAAGGSGTTVPARISVAGTNSGTLQVSPDGGSLVPTYALFNFNPFNLFQLPLEQYRIYGSANYKLADSVEAYSEALFVQSTNSTIIAPSGSFGEVLSTPLSNPFLNAGLRNQICGFDTNSTVDGVQPLYTQAQCDAAALATDPNDPNYRTADLVVSRRFVELGTRNNEYQTTLWQLKAGLRGDITDNIAFDIVSAYGESQVRSQQSGNGILSRLQQAVLATSPTECLDPTGGCVPINLFGPEGSITPEVAAFLDVGNSAATLTSLGQIQAFITGDVGVAVPFAETPINFVLGSEYRRYSASTQSDLLSQTPGEVLGNGAANPNSTGSYDVYELFAELAVPIVEDASFAEELTLQLGGRLSDYSSTGTEYTYKIGGTWTPVTGVQFRGNYQRVTRAPNISELFSPEVTGLDNFSVDPCEGNAPFADPNLLAVCLAQGAPAGTIGSIQVDPAGQNNVTTSGNLDLEAESADTFTIGLVWQPEYVSGLSVTVDYYSIKLTNAISEPTSSDAIAACFGPNFEAGQLSITAASATDPACTAIRRNPATGNLFGSSATTRGLPLITTNRGEFQTDGIDVVARYSLDTDFGIFDFNFTGNWTNSFQINTNANEPTSLDRECVNFYSTNCASIQPEFSFNNRVTWSQDDLAISLNWRWINGVEAEPAVAGNFLGQNGRTAPDDDFRDDFTSIPAEHYFDLSVRYQLLENLQITAAVLNLTDNEPEVVGSNIGATAFNSGNIYPSTYDPLGRRFSLSAKFSF